MASLNNTRWSGGAEGDDGGGGSGGDGEGGPAIAFKAFIVRSLPSGDFARRAWRASSAGERAAESPAREKSPRARQRSMLSGDGTNGRAANARTGSKHFTFQFEVKFIR